MTVCDGTGNFGEPAFFGKDCEILGVSFTDEVFTVVPDACYKIERTWHIINWCAYNANSPITVVPNPNPNATVNHPSNNTARWSLLPPTQISYLRPGRPAGSLLRLAPR